MKRILFFVGLAALLIAVLAACGKKEEPLTAARTIDITLTEFKMDPPELRLKAGETVRLNVRNMGAVEHQFTIGRGPGMHNGSMGFSSDFMDGMRMETMMQNGTSGKGQHGMEMMMRSGGSGQMTMMVPTDRTGEWEMACFLPGHYEGGMHGRVIVE